MVKVVAWIFNQRERVPTFRGVKEERVLSGIISWLRDYKTHIAFVGDQIGGVVIYEEFPDYIYLHLIMVEAPVQMYDLATEWLRRYPGVPVAGWRKKCGKVRHYEQKVVLKSLKLLTQTLPQQELQQN